MAKINLSDYKTDYDLIIKRYVKGFWLELIGIIILIGLYSYASFMLQISGQLDAEEFRILYLSSFLMALFLSRPVGYFYFLKYVPERVKGQAIIKIVGIISIIIFPVVALTGLFSRKSIARKVLKGCVSDNKRRHQEMARELEFELREPEQPRQPVSRANLTREEREEIEFLLSLKGPLLYRIVVLGIFLGAGVILIIYGFIKTIDNFGIEFYLLMGAVIAGLPNLRAHYWKSLETQDRVNRFMGREYKATINLDTGRVTVRKNRDWVVTLVHTFFNIISGGIQAPFMISKHIKEYRLLKELEAEYRQH